MKIYDVTLPIYPGMVIWPGDPSLTLVREKKIEDGANANVSRLEMGVHTGTHVDAPFHFLSNGLTIEALPLEILVGETWVVQIPEDVLEIDRQVIREAKIPEGVTRVLLKTRNSQFWGESEQRFHTDFVGITEGAAEEIVQMGIKLVGIDYLSIAPYKRSRPTHQALLKAGVVIIEGVDLRQVEAGNYQMVCLPLKLVGSDGAPARVILIEEERV